MGTCVNCGAALPDGANNCPSCGYPVRAAATSGAQPPAGIQPPGMTPPPGMPTPGLPPSYGTVAQQATSVAYAGWWQRVGATIIDGIVVAIPAGILAALVGGSTRTHTVIRVDEFGRTIRGTGFEFNSKGILVAVAVGVIYRVLLEGSVRGQTVGKMAMKIAVRDQASGGPIGYGRAFVRWLVASILWVVFILPGLIDVLFPLWDPQHQTLHDKAAGSVVLQVR